MYFCSRLFKNFKKVLILLPLILLTSFIFSSLGNTFAFFDIHSIPAVPLNLTRPIIDISPQLLDAIIVVESANKPYARNRFSGARGLTQITPIAWKELKKHHRKKYKGLVFKHDMHRPAIARQAGEDFLYILQKHLKAKRIPITLDNLLAAYVWGENNLAKYGLQKAPRVVKRYIATVKTLSQISD